MVQMGSTIPPARNSFGTAVSANTSLDNYVLGSYLRSKYATFTSAQMNYTTLKSMGIGNNNGGYATAPSSGQMFTAMFEQTQSKYNTQTLTLRYLWRWTRVLTS